MKKTTAPKSIGAAEAADLKSSLESNQIAKGDSANAAPATDGKKKEEKKPKPQRVERILIRHDFTVQEKADLGGVLADKSRILADMEDEAKACARQYKDKISTVQTEVDSTVNKIKEGFEMVPVEAIVMVQIDRKAKTATKAFYRKDTGVFIKLEDIISNTELELFNVLPENRDLSKPLEAKLLSEQV
jgi:uncharacterized phage infection (PIP) family protein YhgE